MKKYYAIFLNTIFFSVVILIAVIISSIALTKKVDDYKLQNKQGITGSVIKEKIPVLAFSEGVIQKINVKTGDKVTKGDVLVIMDNPGLRTEVDTLQQFKDNISALTQVQVGEQELNNLIVKAPVSGIVGPILVSNGTPIKSLTTLLTIYSTQNIRLLTHLTDSEYEAVRHIPEIRAYNPRLNQSFYITPNILSPQEDQETADSVKKLGLYFKFENPNDAESLLDNEDLQLELTSTVSSAYNPLDYFVNFWNKFLLINQSQ